MLTDSFIYDVTHCNPYPAKIIHLNFQPLEVVSRYRDPQIQVGENYSYLFNLDTNIYKLCCSDTHFAPNNMNLVGWYNRLKTTIVVISRVRFFTWQNDRCSIRFTWVLYMWSSGFVQRKTAVTAHSKSKQSLLFAFAQWLWYFAGDIIHTVIMSNIRYIFFIFLQSQSRYIVRRDERLLYCTETFVLVIAY